MKIISNSVEKTNQIAREIAKTLKGGEVVALYGKLGSGKTTFIQAVAKALGVKSNVPSPTFVLARSYKIPKLEGKILHHIDLYRLDSSSDLRAIDLQEIINNPKNITMIEWAEKAKKELPKERIEIRLKDLGKSKREITITRAN